MPIVKREVKKPVKEKFVPPVAEVVAEPAVIEPTEAKPSVVVAKEVSVSPIMLQSKPTQIKWGLFYIGVVLLVLVVGFSGGLWWGYRQGWGVVSATPTPTPIAQATPAPTPEPVVVERSLIQVDVLNASGVKGKASEVAALVVGLGYKKGTTGNATAQATSTVSFSEDIASLSATIMRELNGVVPGINQTEAPLMGSQRIRLVLGSR